MPDPDWITKATAAFDRRWIDNIVARGGSDLSVADQETFKALCDLDFSTPWPDALAHAERLLVVWQVSDRLAA